MASSITQLFAPHAKELFKIVDVGSYTPPPARGALRHFKLKTVYAQPIRRQSFITTDDFLPALPENGYDYITP